MEIEIRHDRDNGILFEGTKGRIFVNRGKLTGAPVDELKTNPLPSRALELAYKDRSLVDHFRNFFEAARDRKEPIWMCSATIARCQLVTSLESPLG